jgi:hypothetical protein
VEGGDVDIHKEPSDASVSHGGKLVYSLAPGKEASFGRHSTCDIRLDGPRNAKGAPLLSRHVGVLWFRDGRLRIRNTSSHVLIAEADSGDSLRLEPGQDPATGPEGSITGQSVQVSVLLSQWQPATPLQLREELTVRLPDTPWLSRVLASEMDGTMTVSTDLHATEAQMWVLAALCQSKVLCRDRDRPTPSHKDLAHLLNLSQSTVRGHLDKLRSNNSNPPDKDALATMAYERGWVTMETLRRYGLSREATR